MRFGHRRRRAAGNRVCLRRDGYVAMRVFDKDGAAIRHFSRFVRKCDVFLIPAYAIVRESAYARCCRIAVGITALGSACADRLRPFEVAEPPPQNLGRT